MEVSLVNINTYYQCKGANQEQSTESHNCKNFPSTHKRLSR